jgi:hypothetical protein
MNMNFQNRLAGYGCKICFGCLLSGSDSQNRLYIVGHMHGARSMVTEITYVHIDTFLILISRDIRPGQDFLAFLILRTFFPEGGALK